jgi:hypothetical protein
MFTFRDRDSAANTFSGSEHNLAHEDRHLSGLFKRGQGPPSLLEICQDLNTVIALISYQSSLRVRAHVNQL